MDTGRMQGLPEQGIDRFAVTVSSMGGGTATGTFRDRIAAEKFVTRVATRGTRDHGELTGFKIVDTATGTIVREGVAE